MKLYYEEATQSERDYQLPQTSDLATNSIQLLASPTGTE